MCQHRTWGTTCSVLGRISWKKTRSWQTSIRNLKHTLSWTKFNQVEAILNNYQVQEMSRRLTNLLDVAIKCSQISIKKWAPAPELPFGNTKAASIESSLVHSDWENLEENHGFNWCSPKQSHETKITKKPDSWRDRKSSWFEVWNPGKTWVYQPNMKVFPMIPNST